MEDNSKLFVFEKKEVVLIFVFIVVISVTAFTLGVRVGKQLSLKHDGYTKSDVKSINLKSVEEEYVDKVVEKPADFSNQMDNAMAKEKDKAKDVDEIEKRLREEMEKLANESGASGNTAEPQKKMEVTNKPMDNTDPALKEPVGNTTPAGDANNTNAVKGKYTIQLYANQSKSAAEDFADPFIIKGYNVIINEVVIPGKGTWYRVSIGVFGNIDEAKSYLDAEKKLFQTEDYIIQQF